jgi:hypothetical protein
MKKIFLLPFLFLFPLFSFASNFAGGEITFQCVGPNTYYFNISCWTLGQILPSDTVFLDPGDGNSLIILTTPAFTNQLSSSNYYMNAWHVTHAYSGPSGPGGYTISVTFMNRVGGINNIPNSINGRAVLSANVVIDPLIGNNNSPIMTDQNTYIDPITVGQNYSNNPGPVDANGDSMSFSFIPCMDSTGVTAGYLFPDAAGGGVLNINSVTADYSWNSPQVSGAYNVVIRTEEWMHLTNGNYILIGYVMREIQFNSQQVIGINEMDAKKFFIYPNPATSNEKITIHPYSFLGKYHARLYNTFGQIVWEMPDLINCDLELPSLPNGIYFMEIGSENEWFNSEKLIIQN